MLWAVEPAWASWTPSPAWTVGIEEEVMLLDAADWSLAQRSTEVMGVLPEDLRDELAVETHLGAMEYASAPREQVGDAVADLARLRTRLSAALAPLGLRAAAAGTHPSAVWTEVEVTPRRRYEQIHAEMGELARREPTFAQHVHIGVADPEDAVRVMTRLRPHLPLLLALSAGSPFWQGRDTGLASARIPIWQAFPRTGIPRPFARYGDWVETVDALLRCGAFADPSFLWWDIRPVPAYGTVEVRVMDAQPDLDRVAALTALVVSLARLELEEGWAPAALIDAHEVLAENRFLASRDGVRAELVDLGQGCRRSVTDLVEDLLPAVLPHAQDLGCAGQLDGVRALLEDDAADRARAVAGDPPDLARLCASLADRYHVAGEDEVPGRLPPRAALVDQVTGAPGQEVVGKCR